MLAAAVRSRISILVSGGTGAGKTTFLNILSQYIPKNERLVTIEDAAELQLAQENIVRLETRPPNIEGREPSASVNCSSTVSVCAPTASSLARFAAKKRSTCCRR